MLLPQPAGATCTLGSLTVQLSGFVSEVQSFIVLRKGRRQASFLFRACFLREVSLKTFVSLVSSFKSRISGPNRNFNDFQIQTNCSSKQFEFETMESQMNFTARPNQLDSNASTNIDSKNS